MGIVARVTNFQGLNTSQKCIFCDLFATQVYLVQPFWAAPLLTGPLGPLEVVVRPKAVQKESVKICVLATLLVRSELKEVTFEV